MNPAREDSLPGDGPAAEATMKFHRVPPDESYNLGRWIDQTGRYEAGFFQVLFGVRVRAGPRGCAWCDVDLCAGADLEFAVRLLHVVLGILQTFPPGAPGGEIRALIPRCEVRPINLDPCWPRLLEILRERTGNRPDKPIDAHT